jgi:hypothetical protein
MLRNKQQKSTKKSVKLEGQLVQIMFQIQSDKIENKSEQALQIICDVVAEFYADKRSMHGRRQFVVSNATL